MVPVHQHNPDIAVKYELTHVVALSEFLQTSMAREIVRVNIYGHRGYTSVVSELPENVHSVLEICR